MYQDRSVQFKSIESRLCVGRHAALGECVELIVKPITTFDYLWFENCQ